MSSNPVLIYVESEVALHGIMRRFTDPLGYTLHVTRGRADTEKLLQSVTPDLIICCGNFRSTNPPLHEGAAYAVELQNRGQNVIVFSQYGYLEAYSVAKGDMTALMTHIAQKIADPSLRGQYGYRPQP